MSKAKSDLATVPAVRPANEFPEVRRLTQRLDQLRERRADAEAKLTGINRRLSGRERVEADAVRALLGPADLPADMIALDGSALRAEGERLDREAKLLGLAIGEGESLLAQAKARVTSDALADVRQWQRSLVAECGRRLCEVQRLLALEREARRAVEAAGFGWGDLAILSPQFLRDTACDSDNLLALWLRQMVADGVLTGREPWLPGGVDDSASPEAVARREAETARRAEIERVEARKRSKANGDLMMSNGEWQ